MTGAVPTDDWRVEVLDLEGCLNRLGVPARTRSQAALAELHEAHVVLGKHLPGRHLPVTHESLTVRTPGEPTEHRPLRRGEVEEWLTALEVALTPDERARLLDRVHRLTA